MIVQLIYFLEGKRLKQLHKQRNFTTDKFLQPKIFFELLSQKKLFKTILEF